MDTYEDRAFATNLVVGLLVIAIVAGLAIVTAFFLSKESPLARTYALRVRFADVAGLKVGAPVTLMGAGVGRVEAMLLAGPEPPRFPSSSWIAELAVRDEPWIHERLTTTTAFTVQPESVFGNKYVNATFGDGGEPLAPGAVVQGAVGAGIDAKTFDKLSLALDNLADASKTLKQALNEQNRDEIKATLDDMSKTAHNLANVTERMKAGMDSWTETMEKLRFWKGWFGNDGERKKPQPQ